MSLTKIKIDCPDCSGMGLEPEIDKDSGEYPPCAECEGTGKIEIKE